MNKTEALEKIAELIAELEHYYTPPTNPLEGEFSRGSRASPQNRKFISDCWEAFEVLEGDE